MALSTGTGTVSNGNAFEGMSITRAHFLTFLQTSLTQICVSFDTGWDKKLVWHLARIEDSIEPYSFSTVLVRYGTARNLRHFHKNGEKDEPRNNSRFKKFENHTVRTEDFIYIHTKFLFTYVRSFVVVY